MRSIQIFAVPVIKDCVPAPPGLAPFVLVYTSQLDKGTAKPWDKYPSPGEGESVCATEGGSYDD